MERLEGEPLAKRIARGPVEEREVIRIAIEVLSALEAAHGARLVHRDLKPDNIFLANVPGIGVQVKVLDFGIAKALDDEGGAKLTATGALIGTLMYMAPEQARGAAVDERTDLYSLGAVVYEALTGRPAFDAKGYEKLLLAILSDAPRPLDEAVDATGARLVSPQLAAIVARAMAKRPEERFQSAREMAREMAALSTLAAEGKDAEGEGAGRRSASPSETSAPLTTSDAAGARASTSGTRDARRVRRVLVAALSLAAVSVAALALWSFTSRRTPPSIDTMQDATPVSTPAVAPIRPVADSLPGPTRIGVEPLQEPEPSGGELTPEVVSRPRPTSTHARPRARAPVDVRMSSLRVGRYPIASFRAAIRSRQDWSTCWSRSNPAPEIDRGRCFHLEIGADGRVINVDSEPMRGPQESEFLSCMEARLTRLEVDAAGETCPDCMVCFLIDH
jgi:serine/threonine-protein kinase